MFKWLLGLIKNGIKKVINFTRKVISSWFNVDHNDTIEVDEVRNFDIAELLSTIDNNVDCNDTIEVDENGKELLSIVRNNIRNKVDDDFTNNARAGIMHYMLDDLKGQIDDSLHSELTSSLRDFELAKGINRAE